MVSSHQIRYLSRKINGNRNIPQNEFMNKVRRVIHTQHLHFRLKLPREINVNRSINRYILWFYHVIKESLTGLSVSITRFS